MLDKLFSKFRKERPASLPGYVALGLIRQGSMSTIFKARDQKSGRVVAVKVHKPEAHRNIEGLESPLRALTEGEITASFDHPNVVQCFEHGKLGPTPYLVLEYLDGVTLASLLAGNSKRLEGKRMVVIRQAAEALAHVHKKRFIHYDVSPKNLFLTKDGVVKLIDFGLACPLLDHPMRVARTGTTGILAPEALRREPCTYKVDVFAWGVMAYQVLSGHWPFESADHRQTLNKILNVSPIALDRRVPAIPKEVASLIMRALHKNPSERLGNMTSAVSVLLRHKDVAL